LVRAMQRCLRQGVLGPPPRAGPESLPARRSVTP
jgi:hypothetical protein